MLVTPQRQVSQPAKSFHPPIGLARLASHLCCSTRYLHEPKVVVFANTIPVSVAVPADDVLTRIRLCPAALLLSLSRLGGVRGTCQADVVFVVGGECFDFLHASCVGGGD